MKTLSPRQLATLGSVSNRAYKHLQSVGYPLPAYSEWRHEFTADQCGGRSSWKSLYQVDYIPLYNAFVAIFGGKQKADNTPQSDEAALLWTLRDRARFWELSTAYIAAIARDKFGTDNLQTLTCHQLRQLLITIQARGRRRTAKTAERFEVDAPAEVHTSRSTVPPSRLKDWRGDIDASPRPTRRKRSAAPQQTAP